MRGYNWKAIPESTWAGFSAAVAGLVVAIMVAFGADAALTGAVGVFIAAFFRLVIALIGAVASSEGTVTVGELPTGEGGQLSNLVVILAAVAVILVCFVWLFGPFTVGR